MNLNKTTALTLRIGVVIGIALMVVGLIGSEIWNNDMLLYAGILVLIVSPFIGVIVTFICLLKEKDRFWSIIAGILLIITATGALLSI